MSYQMLYYNLCEELARLGGGGRLSYYRYCGYSLSLANFVKACLDDPLPLEKDMREMATKTKTPKEKAGVSKNKTAYNKKRYVKVPLLPDDREKVLSLAEEPHNVLVLLDDMVKAGYSVRCAFDEENEIVSVFVDGDKTAVNHGQVLESHGANLALVLAVSVYRVAVKRDFGAWEAKERDDSWFS